MWRQSSWGLQCRPGDLRRLLGEQRNIAHDYEPYRSYKEIGRLSLDEAFRHFGIAGGNPDSIQHYFDAFTELRTQMRCRLSKSFRSVIASRWSQISTMICSRGRP